MSKITVGWELSGQGVMEIDPKEIEGMSDDEIDDWVLDGVRLEIHEQSNFSIGLRGMPEALKRLREGQD